MCVRLGKSERIYVYHWRSERRRLSVWCGGTSLRVLQGHQLSEWHRVCMCVSEWQMELVTGFESKAIVFTQEALLPEFVLTRWSAKRRSRYSSLNAHTHAFQRALSSCKFGSCWQTEVLCDRSEYQPITWSTCWWVTIMNLFVVLERERVVEIMKDNCDVLVQLWVSLLHETAAVTHTHTHTRFAPSASPTQ